MKPIACPSLLLLLRPTIPVPGIQHLLALRAVVLVLALTGIPTGCVSPLPPPPERTPAGGGASANLPSTKNAGKSTSTKAQEPKAQEPKAQSTEGGPTVSPDPSVEPISSAPVAAPETSPEGGGWSLQLEPEAETHAAPQVLRFHLIGLANEPLDQFWLFRDVLSNYHLGRIKKIEIPGTLAARQIPTRSWLSQGQVVVAPTEPLEPTQVYTLASPSRGLLAEITVASAEEQRLMLKRLWPPRDATVGAVAAVYCLDTKLNLVSQDVLLSPGAVVARLQGGLAGPGTPSTECTTWLGATGADTPDHLLPPVVVGDFSVDPTPLLFSGLPVPPPPAECPALQVPLGPGCVAVNDNRAELCSPGAPRFWALRHGDNSISAALPAGGCMTLSNLPANAEVDLEARYIELNGYSEEPKMTVTTSSPRPRVLLNEVLSNPLGPEPQQEWVELFNDGSVAAQLEGYVLSDAGGAVTLPAFSLEPGAFVLLVQESYDASRTDDVMPLNDAMLLHLPNLGKNGLSNSGEALTLFDATGLLISEFPAVASKKAGISLARAFPWSQDNDPNGFAPSADPGATPGEPNSNNTTLVAAP